MQHLEVEQPLWLSFLTWSFKWLSGFLLSFVVSVVGLSLLDYGTFSFVFVLIASQVLFWKFFHDMGLVSLLIFDAIMVFVFLVSRLYVVLGPDL